MGSLFSRSSHKVPKMSLEKDLECLKTDPGLLTIPNDSCEPMLKVNKRRLSQYSQKKSIPTKV